MEPAEYRLMDQAEAGMWWYRALHARIADALRATSGRVLDAGCGTGGLLARLSADASFAAVVSADVLCHAAVDPQAALAELRRVLTPGGLLILNMPSYQWLMSAHDHQVHNARRTTATALARDLHAAGFAQPRARYWNTLLLPLMILQRKLLNRGNTGETVSDVAAFPPMIDATFHALTELERRLPVPLPAGGSVLATARKPENP